MTEGQWAFKSQRVGRWAQERGPVGIANTAPKERGNFGNPGNILI